MFRKFKEWKFFSTPSLSQQKYMIAVQRMEAGIKLSKSHREALKITIRRRRAAANKKPVLPKHWFAPQRIATKPRVRVRLHKVWLGTVIRSYAVEAYVYAAPGNFWKLRDQCKNDPSLLRRGVIRTWTVLSFMLFFLSSVPLHAAEGGVNAERKLYLSEPSSSQPVLRAAQQRGLHVYDGPAGVHRIRTVHYKFQKPVEPLPHYIFTTEAATDELTTTKLALHQAIDERELEHKHLIECQQKVPEPTGVSRGLMVLSGLLLLAAFFGSIGGWLASKSNWGSKVRNPI